MTTTSLNITDEQRRLFDALSLPVMMLDRDMRFVYGNDAYFKAVHASAEELLGNYVFDIFQDTQERVNSIKERFERTFHGEVTTLDAQPFRIEMEDGSVEELIWQATQDPYRDETGQIVGLIQRVADITIQHELEQRNKAIGYELNHRVKNTMAVVTSIARITGRNARDVEHFVKSFTARVSAMSRTNDMLARQDWKGLTIRDVFSDELEPYQEDGKPVYSLKGPRVRLSIDATKDLSMVAHELATNATKYGCLVPDGGKLAVDWIRNSDEVIITWREHCSGPIEAPTQTGFGTRLFDMLPYVEVERDFTPTGLHMTITLQGDTVFG